MLRLNRDRLGGSARDYAVAIGLVAITLIARELLQLFGQFYYLPWVPAAMLTAMLVGRRGPTALVIVLAITLNIVQVPREHLVDVLLNATLFAAVCWSVAEISWRLRDIQAKAADLARRLARRNQMLDAILAASPVVTLDGGGRIQMATPSARAVLGAGEGVVIGKPFGDFVEGFSIDQARGQEVDVVWTGRRADGQTYPLSIHIGLMDDETGGPSATLSLTDLTQAQAADARARELHTQLNRVWRLNSLGEMAASLAHELNQPLSAATNYLHAAQGSLSRFDMADQSVGQTLELAKSQLLRAGSIIRRMRELLAHETRSLGVERVAAMIADMQGVLSMIERDASMVIEYRIDDLNDRVRAERIQFQQAVINLVRNAGEALAGQDDRRVRIVGRPVSDDAYEVRVEDNGPGVPDDQLDTIFKPLTTTKSAGMGLGLSVTRTIVESHGGTLSVGRGELGGASFGFSLMRDQELEEA